jgi:hypothetical protein
MKKLLVILVALMACKGQNKRTFKPDFVAGPVTLVYKTKHDYQNLVPVMLSEDKREIVSYPNPNDIKSDLVLATPIGLNKGYYLDNRGIGLHVAFLKMTYQEYATLEKAPTLAELQALIIDKDPLVELCNCGSSKVFTNQVEQLNALIDKGTIRSVCKVLK